jgi:signal peptidase I
MKPPRTWRYASGRLYPAIQAFGTDRSAELPSDRRFKNLREAMTEPMSLKDGKIIGTSKKSQEGGFGEIVKVVVQALLIALVVRTFLFQPFNIPSGSLIPTLDIGDYLFVSKYSYGYSRYSFPLDFDVFSGRILASTPKRGDVAVFKFPKDTSKDYIKRVIGLPGDKIQIINARLIINGQMVPREATTKVTTKDQFGHEVEVPTYLETLPGGVTHQIIQLDGDQGISSNTDVYTVPPGNYFMMGDNRDNSSDSRISPDQDGVGYVPFENFVGRAELIFFSIDDGTPAWQFWRWPWTIRWDRLLKPVR